MENRREFDLIIFGATGFTGFFMVRELLLTIADDPAKYSSLKWAIAGRSMAKLDDTLVKLAKELIVNLSKVRKIKADVADPSSLLRMAERSSVIVNGVGPYIAHGRQVVEACLKAGTHHIDISCELLYVESMLLEYDALARDNGTLIITNCGFGSIVTDMGVCYLKDHFEGRLHSVESFFRMFLGPKQYTVNFGTLHSAVYLISNCVEYFRIHSRLYKKVLTKPLPRSRVSLSMHWLPFRKHSGWNLPYLAGDKETVMRSQHYNYQFFDERRPVQFQPYMTFPSLFVATLFLLFGMFITIFSVIKPLRVLLEKWPEALTFGYFSKNGPTREQIETNHFETIFQGKGWSTNPSDDTHSESVRSFDKEVTLVVSGQDVAYKTTATCAIQAGLTLLGDRKHMPKGGVLTPGSAFQNTDLVKRLNVRDLKFKLV